MRMVCVHKITVPFAPNKLLINEVDGNFLCRRLNNNSIALCKNMQMLCVLSKVSVNFCSHLPHGRCGLKCLHRTLQLRSRLSPSARKVWIEICTTRSTSLAPPSPSTWKVWIEISFALLRIKAFKLSPSLRKV